MGKPTSDERCHDDVHAYFRLRDRIALTALLVGVVLFFLLPFLIWEHR